jgi:surfeit locus 1 family protein
VRQYAVLVIGLIAAALFMRLGVWQLDRLGERRGRNSRLAARLAAPPVGLGDAGWDTGEVDSLRYRRAQAAGVFDFTREIVVTGRSVRGAPGVSVVTPLVVGPDRAVLVERGWTASADGRTVQLASLRERDTATVEGVLLLPAEPRVPGAGGTAWPRYLRRPLPRALQGAYPYQLHPLLLRRTAHPVEAPVALRAVPAPPLTEGPHLSYAVQWFAFATIAIVGSVLLYLKTRREAGAEGGVAQFY